MSQCRERKYCAEPAGTTSIDGGPSIRWHVSSFDGSTQPYAFYTPPDYDPARQWPLVISLHGYSSDHVLNLRRVFGRGNAPDEPDCRAKVCIPRLPDVGFLVASPYGFGSIGYDGAAETDVMDVLADVLASFNVDPDRIYLTGLSMGGAGTWAIVTRYPDIFAAIAPVCPPLDFRAFAEGRGPVNSFERLVCDQVASITHVRNAVSVPVKVCHGTDDSVVPIEDSRRMVARAREVGCSVEYVEYPGVDHNAWDPTYQDASIFRWFGRFTRKEARDVVDFSTGLLRWSRCHWVKIVQIEERPHPAWIRAEIVGQSIQVWTENIAAFEITLDKAPITGGSSVTVAWNGEQVFSGVPSGVLSFGDAETGLVKRAGLEGPFADALRDRYTLVYGACDDGTGTAEATRREAERLACRDEWVDIAIPVKADVDVTRDDIEQSNLVLLGSPATNSVIRRLNDSLPVRFAPGGVLAGRRMIPAKDAGLLLVYPNPENHDRCVAVIGGESPATITKAATNWRFAPDYVVFDAATDFSAEESILDWGFFNNRWQFGK